MTKLSDRIMRRQGRVRGTLRRAAGERKRLTVFRSSKHIYAQVIDDDEGVTLASASSIEKTAREGLKTGASVDAAKSVGKLIARARQGEGRQGRGVRPRRLPLSRPGQSFGRGGARRRTELLKHWKANELDR